MPTDLKPGSSTRRIAGTLHRRRYIYPIPAQGENLQTEKKAEEDEVADRHRDRGREDHEDVR